MRINTEYKTYVTKEEAIENLACEVVNKAISDYKNKKFMENKKNAILLEKFFLNGMCDFYLGLINTDITAYKLYKYLQDEKGGAEYGGLKER